MLLWADGGLRSGEAMMGLGEGVANQGTVLFSPASNDLEEWPGLAGLARQRCLITCNMIFIEADLSKTK